MKLSWGRGGLQGGGLQKGAGKLGEEVGWELWLPVAGCTGAGEEVGFREVGSRVKEHIQELEILAWRLAGRFDSLGGTSTNRKILISVSETTTTRRGLFLVIKQDQHQVSMLNFTANRTRKGYAGFFCASCSL